jgi:hypothetical protein
MRDCEGRCGRSYDDDGEEPPAETAETVPKFLCLGCALSFAVHEEEAGRPFPYATQGGAL